MTKFEILFQAGKKEEKERQWDMRRMVQTEMEYLVITCKSVFDLYQELISLFWAGVTFTDPSITKKTLPDRFRNMIANGEILLSQNEIKEKNPIPDKLAECYAKHAPFFMRLRKIRDGIVHLGNPVSQTIFNTEYGFAVVKDSYPFNGLELWHSGFELPNKLVSLRPVLAYLVLNTFSACEELTAVISKVIVFPTAIVPDFHVFLRGAHVRELLQLKEVLEKCLWWKETPK